MNDHKASAAGGAPRRLTRRELMGGGLRLAAGVAVTGAFGEVLAACSTGTKTGRPLSHGVSNLTPKRGGTLRFGLAAEDSYWYDPVTARYDQTGIMYARTVYDPLATVGPDGQVYPYLAQSIDHNAGYTAWTITMRPGIEFHDGTPCDAAAVVANFKRVLDTNIAGNIAQFGIVGMVDKVVATGPLSVEISMSQPWVPFDYYLAGGIGGQVAWMAAPSMFKGAKEPTKPIGTGPFVFQEWVPGSHFTAVRNQRYWRRGMPYLDEITYVPVVSGRSIEQSLRAGSLDIIQSTDVRAYTSFRNDPSYSFIDDVGPVVGEPDVDCILLNTAKAPFNDVRLRRALAYATDQNRYIKEISSGITTPAKGPFFAGSPYYGPTGYPSYDPAQARSLVAEVRRSTGKPISLEFSDVAGSGTNVDIVSLFKSMWGDVGITVVPNFVDQSTLINNVIVGKFDVADWRQFGAFDPDMNYIFWDPGSPLTFSRLDDPVLHADLETGRTSPDPTVRATAYKKIAETFGSEIPYVWTDRALWSVTARAPVMNFANPTTPEGHPALAMFGGVVWPTQIWLNS